MDLPPKDISNLGLSEDMHMKLREMTDNDLFNDMKDGYRLAVTIALSRKLNVDERSLIPRKNMYDVGGIDEEFILRNAIRKVFPERSGTEYGYLEKLADAGVEILYEGYEKTKSLDFELVDLNAS